MPSDCKRFNVGDKGQRYEIHYIEIDTHEDKTFGWCDEEPDKLAYAASLMPSAERVYTLDREENECER